MSQFPLQARSSVSAARTWTTAQDETRGVLQMLLRRYCFLFERRLRVLLLGEGSIATTTRRRGAGGAGAPTRRGRLSIPCRDAEVPRVLVARNRLLKSTFRPRPRVAADTIVQSLSGDADELSDCLNEKDLQMQAFSKAAEGIRTLDLLHGKQLLTPPTRPEIPANMRNPADERHDGFPGIAAKSQRFRQGRDNERVVDYPSSVGIARRRTEPVNYAP
jgi:hypothetical protein